MHSWSVIILARGELLFHFDLKDGLCLCRVNRRSFLSTLLFSSAKCVEQIPRIPGISKRTSSPRHVSLCQRLELKRRFYAAILRNLLKLLKYWMVKWAGKI
ncbi:hypothetical protein L6164_031133 [Bauhinia variegata]|uniref:Uncharacterized protein n=1 Tax=Bauhinia variegata TaxID=167791 RepID=A0ACB9LE29_BAUVA|nr:hypothetical protein L6164_031133 [Bauhinia variegata]